jgi:fermentation-respiration switch protein FrsA (DUF1100 family)
MADRLHRQTTTTWLTHLNRWFSLLIIKVVIGLACLLGLVVLGFTAWLYFNQSKLIFPAQPLPPDYQFMFDQPFEEFDIPVKDGSLNALYFPQPNSRGLVFFLRGNGGNLVDWTTQLEFYEQANYDLFIFDYRGYGKSRGTIRSPEQIHEDVQVLWDFITPRYHEKKIVIYGRSIGTALATRLATEVSADLLILVSPFTSVTALAKQQYPFVPKSLVRFPFATEAIIGNVNTPIAFAHGSEDEMFSPAHAQTLYDLTRAHKDIKIIQGAGHGDIHLFDDYLNFFAAKMP